VDTNFKLHPVVERGLLLGLKFILYPKAQHKSLSTLITAYTHDTKSHFENIAQAGGKSTFKQNEQLYTSFKQYLVCQILHYPNWTELHKCHDIMMSDKNMGTTIIAYS
jgi:hypothetical protein